MATRTGNRRGSTNDISAVCCAYLWDGREINEHLLEEVERVERLWREWRSARPKKVLECDKELGRAVVTHYLLSCDAAQMLRMVARHLGDWLCYARRAV